MKVVQTKAWSERRLKANRGCRYCPNCGEGKTEKKYLEEGITGKGITHYVYPFSTGVLNQKRWQIDKYSCKTCGTRWESKKYRIDK